MMNLSGFINNNINGGANYGAIGGAINNNVNNMPSYGAVSSAIDENVKSKQGGTNYGGLAMQMLQGMKPQQQSSEQQQQPKINFQPIMMQPQYVGSNFQNQPSYIARNNLYDYLTRY